MTKIRSYISPVGLGALAVILLIGVPYITYSLVKMQGDATVAGLQKKLDAANAKIVDLTPNTSGLFDRTKAKVGDEVGYKNWTVSSIDAETGDVHLKPTETPAIVTGVFQISSESGPCLVFEQVALESGKLPSATVDTGETFCSEGEGAGAAQFGTHLKQYFWASVEISNLHYTTDHGNFASIDKVLSITPLKDSGTP